MRRTPVGNGRLDIAQLVGAIDEAIDLGDLEGGGKWLNHRCDAPAKDWQSVAAVVGELEAVWRGPEDCDAMRMIYGSGRGVS